jgi:gliding motility-associated-like protein
MKSTFVLTLLSIFLFGFSHAQLGKNGDVTISSTTIVNEFTYLTTDANANATSISVNNSNLNDNIRFSTNLSAGDLILIIQHQGATINSSTSPEDWGDITSYNNSGNYEYCEVKDVPNSSTIEIRCGLVNDYTATGNVQVVRIPRYNNLTINSVLTTEPWNGQSGGVLAIECANDLVIANSGTIDASELGFRGGIEDYAASMSYGWDVALVTDAGGGVKGESIFGYDNDYTPIGGKYGYGAPANGGGGGNNHNAGGGGGANSGVVSNWQIGVGVPDPAHNAAWALETPPINNVVASGGGKGGYTFSANNGNEYSTGPNDFGVWGGDGRRPLGGLGGRPLDYSTGKIFFGGGGGSGDVNDAQTLGGHGGNSGGIILIECKGTVSGNGEIIANGGDGIDAYTTSPPTTSYAGNDGAGGGGAGGTVIIKAYNPLSNVIIKTKGGNGGNQVLDGGFLYFGSFNEAEGPGGGGGGGYIAHSNGTIISDVSGGINGTTNSDAITNFPPNGATSGGVGTINNSLNTFTLEGINDTICAGNSATVSVQVNGTLPSGGVLIWYDAPSDGNFIGAGTTFSTTNVSNDTTFYVGVCPGTYTIPVSVIMGTSFSYSDANVQIDDENCGNEDGSITGITISGGALPLQYEWNGILAASQDLLNAEAGTYTLVVTDNNGCAATIGTYNLNENNGPTFDDTGLIITDDHCSQGIGSINGMNLSGNAPYTYTWNGTNASSLDTNLLSAGNYILSVEDVNGCINDYSVITLNDIDGPTIDTSSVVVTNSTCELNNGAINGITISNPSNSVLTIQWDNSSDTILDIQDLASGDYSIVVTDGFGCTDNLGPISVSSIGNPIAQFDITPNPALIGDSVFYINSSSNDVSDYYFTLSNNTLTYDTTAYEVFSSIGEYEICLNVSNTAGCMDSTCQTLIVDENIIVIVPNVFSPNNDGANDTFIIQGMTNSSLTVFNRWGKEVFSQSPYTNGWDGYTNAGKKLAGGTYYYILQPLDDDSSFDKMNGYVLLIR